MAPNRQLRKTVGISGWPNAPGAKLVPAHCDLKGTSVVFPLTAPREAELWAEVAYIIDE